MKNLEQLKQISDAAAKQYNEEAARLTELGYKSKERYVMLKEFKSALDVAHTATYKASTKHVCNELDKIIAKQTPAQRAEGLRRARSFA